MTEHEHQESIVNRPARPVGIVGYGSYVPRYRLPNKEISRIWKGEESPGPVIEKAVAGLDEDVITMSIEAARNALKRSGIDASQLRAVWVGSESHPYAVKPSGTIVAEAIGAPVHIQAGDWEFACKAGTEALVAAMAWWGRRWVNMPWRLGWIPLRESPAMLWNILLLPAAPRSSLVRRKIPWRRSKRNIPM